MHGPTCICLANLTPCSRKFLPYAPTGVRWPRGGTGTTKWAIRSNHGGGYQFRLCKRSEELTEACMQRTPLAFATQVHRLEFNDGTNATIPGRYVSTVRAPSACAACAAA